MYFILSYTFYSNFLAYLNQHYGPRAGRNEEWQIYYIRLPYMLFKYSSGADNAQIVQIGMQA